MWAAVHCCGGWTRLSSLSGGSRLWTSAPWERGSHGPCSAWRPLLLWQQWGCQGPGWSLAFSGLLQGSEPTRKKNILVEKHTSLGPNYFYKGFSIKSNKFFFFWSAWCCPVNYCNYANKQEELSNGRWLFFVLFFYFIYYWWWHNV